MKMTLDPTMILGVYICASGTSFDSNTCKDVYLTGSDPQKCHIFHLQETVMMSAPASHIEFI